MFQWKIFKENVFQGRYRKKYIFFEKKQQNYLQFKN